MNVREAFPRNGGEPSIPIEDILDRLAGDTPALCKQLLPNGHREGQEWRCGSVNGEPGKSLGVHLTGGKAGVWSDFAAGEGGDILDLIQKCLNLDKAQAVRWGKDWLRIDGNMKSPSRCAAPAASTRSHRADDDKERTKKALAIWKASQPAPGTPVESYLKHRGITIPVPPSLRYNPSVWYASSGLSLPCMVAAVQSPDRRIVAIHRTYIRLDGRGKASIVTPKMALGPLGAGAVRLGPANAALGIAEGIETGLSAMQLFGLPVWCALGSRLHRIALPEVVHRVVIFADSGEAGMEAADKALKTFSGQGHKTEICAPDLGDFNDVLNKGETV